jgi:hypothetical protein
MDSPIASDDEVDSIEVDSMPSFSSAGTYRNFWIRPHPNMSQFTLENEGMSVEVDKLMALHVVHAVGLQLIRYPYPLDSNDVNGATEQRVMFLLFVQGKASGATAGIGASGVINRSSMQKIADESNGRV